MKARDQTYRQDAASLLRDISMYRALRKEQLLRLYPGKEQSVRMLLDYLVKQSRIYNIGTVYCADPSCADSVDWGLLAAVWVLVDFIDRVEFHSIGEFPAKVIFIADGKVYEVVHIERGKETMMCQIMGRRGDDTPLPLVLVDDPAQINGLELPNVCGYCTVSPDGEVQYYQKE